MLPRPVGETAQPQFFHVVPVVTGHDDGDVEFLHEVDEKCHDLPRCDGVQRGRRFVRDHDRGFVGQRAGNGDPLALPHRKQGRALIEMTFDFQGFRQLLDGPIVRHAEQAARKTDIIPYRQIGQQATGLHHVTHALPAKIAQMVQFAPFPVVSDIQRGRAGFRSKSKRTDFGRLQHHGQQIQQSAFAATALTNQGNLLAECYLEAGHHQPKGRTLGLTRLYDFAQVIDKYPILGRILVRFFSRRPPRLFGPARLIWFFHLIILPGFFVGGCERL